LYVTLTVTEVLEVSRMIYGSRYECVIASVSLYLPWYIQ
jgi:hypothetical protein